MTREPVKRLPLCLNCYLPVLLFLSSAKDGKEELELMEESNGQCLIDQYSSASRPSGQKCKIFMVFLSLNSHKRPVM